MSELFQNIYNPDVLNCLANLSNDEVFTPPDVVNQMLDMLPDSLWHNPSATFLDPACKTGVFLREIAKRLLKGLEKEIPELQVRIDHIFQKQLYGIAITEMTSLLSRRSVYCSKYASGKYSVAHFERADGNIRHKKILHHWSNGHCLFCGASQSEYDRDLSLETHAYEFLHSTKPEVIFNMKFDVIISNPPYQLSDGGAQASAKPIYNLFIQQAKKLMPQYLCMITPSRWFAGGKGLDQFREEMLKDKHIKIIHDFIDASECFNGVEIKGGVNYFLWDRSHKGECEVVSHNQNNKLSRMRRYLLEEGCDVFIRYNEAISILHKIKSKGEPSFSDIVRSAMSFGFRTFFKEFKSKLPYSNSVKVYANHSIGYIDRKDVLRNTQWIDKWKVILPEAIGTGNITTDLLKPIISEPGSISTETYVMNGPYNSSQEAENVVSYINTKLFHFLVGLKKITQHTTSKTYEFVPQQDLTHSWDDRMLYDRYELTNDDIAFIESMIRPMDLNGDSDDE
jgi:site-specific DNA-methyltransferase (adenine-specific)